MTYYKWLNADGTSGIKGWRWPAPGEWTDELTGLVLCERGYHACDETQLTGFINAQLWTFEGRGEHIADTEKHVFGQGRILERVTAWDDARLQRLFACDCAERVLHLVSEPQRTVCAETIEVARRFANGDATDRELAAAWAAARDAARAAAGAAARDAARAAAGAAAGAAAWAAAGAAAWAAAGAAAWAAAGAAAGAAGRNAAEVRWQSAHLLAMLELQP